MSRILFSEPPILREDEFTNIREVASWRDKITNEEGIEEKREEAEGKKESLARVSQTSFSCIVIELRYEFWYWNWNRLKQVFILRKI